MEGTSAFFKCLVSPTLYYSFTDHWEKYQPNTLESFGISVISALNLIKSLGSYTTPVLIWFLYRRGYMSPDGVLVLGKITVALCLIMGTSYCIRSYGRATNPRYRDFLRKLNKYQTNGSVDDVVKEIKRFDFDFSAWPIQFASIKSLEVDKIDGTTSGRSIVSSFISSPCSIIGFAVMHTFGIRLLYPGSMSIINYLLSKTQIDGRINLIENLGGERFKLKTVDRNYIDTMFVDKRKSNSTKGKVLVICSEGNAGFYENGIMPTAIEAGFSVLGWNHPGFGCSTGMPYLDQEQNAIDTVMQFAIRDLDFPANRIILFGWSIGGYSTAWASNKYPDVKQVIADATFDDVLPLAQNQMPEFLDSIVRMTIRCYADLNIAKLLVEYQGSIKMVRRTQDEVISIEPGNVSTNRGNYLLHRILKRRYPQLFNAVSEGALQNWLDTSGLERSNFVAGLNVKHSECESLINNYISTHGKKFPFRDLGKGLSEDDSARLLIYLADNYMVDYNSTHCVPLPSSIFQSLALLN